VSAVRTALRLNAVHCVSSAVDLFNSVVLVDRGHRCPVLSGITVLETVWWLLLHCGVVLRTCDSRLWVPICGYGTVSMNALWHSEIIQAVDVGNA
jgi:hypothetical protein